MRFFDDIRHLLKPEEEPAHEQRIMHDKQLEFIQVRAALRYSEQEIETMQQDIGLIDRLFRSEMVRQIKEAAKDIEALKTGSKTNMHIVSGMMDIDMKLGPQARSRVFSLNDAGIQYRETGIMRAMKSLLQENTLSENDRTAIGKVLLLTEKTDRPECLQEAMMHDSQALSAEVKDRIGERLLDSMVDFIKHLEGDYPGFKKQLGGLDRMIQEKYEMYAAHEPMPKTEARISSVTDLLNHMQAYYINKGIDNQQARQLDSIRKILTTARYITGYESKTQFEAIQKLNKRTAQLEKGLVLAEPEEKKALLFGIDAIHQIAGCITVVTDKKDIMPGVENGIRIGMAGVEFGKEDETDKAIDEAQSRGNEWYREFLDIKKELRRVCNENMTIAITQDRESHEAQFEKIDDREVELRKQLWKSYNNGDREAFDAVKREAEAFIDENKIDVDAFEKEFLDADDIENAYEPGMEDHDHEDDGWEQ